MIQVHLPKGIFECPGSRLLIQRSKSGNRSAGSSRIAGLGGEGGGENDGDEKKDKEQETREKKR